MCIRDRDGIEEVQHTDQPNDETERTAQQQEHGAHTLKFPSIGGLAPVSYTHLKCGPAPP